MSKITKRDLKALTILGMQSALVESDLDADNKIIFITSFGYVIPETIVFDHPMPDDLNKDNIGSFMTFNAVESAKDILNENGNEDALDEQTCFVLENVQIKNFESGSQSNLTHMILFSEQIVGVSFGNLSE